VIVPQQLLVEILKAKPEVVDAAPGGIEVGGMTIDQQKLGCISIEEKGFPRINPNLPVLWQRFAVMCHAPTEAKASKLAQVVIEAIDKQRRKVVEQPSSGESFLVHYTHVTAGPSLNRAENKDTWVELLFVEAMFGTEEV